MTRLTRASLALLMVSAAWAQLPAPASQVQDLPYQVRYISNLNLGDSSVNITNSGAQGAGLQSGTGATLTGALCANIYTFSPDEQLISCCSCPVTPNGLVSLSARLDLINNTLTPAVPTSIVVKILGSVPVVPTGAAPGAAVSCANSASNPAGVGGLAITAATAPVGLVAWATTVHRGPTVGTVNTGPLQLTETQFSPSFLSDAANSTAAVATGAANVGELARLTRLCTFIQANGSGFGICNSCRLGGLGAGRL